MKETSLLNERNVDDQQSLSQRSIPIYKKDINGYTVVHNISSSPSQKHSNSRTCPSSAINRSHMKKTISNLYVSNIANIKHVPLDLHVNSKLIHKHNNNNNKSTITTTPPTPNGIIKNKSAACLINKCFSISKSINDKHKSFEDKASLTSRTSLFKHNISMNNSNSNHHHSFKQQRNSLLPSLQVFQLGSTHLKRATTTSKLFNNMIVVNKVKEHKPKRIRLITNIKQRQQQQQHQRNNIKVHSICFNKEEHINKKDSIINALLPNESNKESVYNNNNNTNIKLKFPIKLNKTKINHKPRSIKEKYIQFINARCELNKKVFPLNEASTFNAIKSIRRKQYNPFNI